MCKSRCVCTGLLSVCKRGLFLSGRITCWLWGDVCSRTRRAFSLCSHSRAEVPGSVPGKTSPREAPRSGRTCPRRGEVLELPAGGRCLGSLPQQAWWAGWTASCWCQHTGGAKGERPYCSGSLTGLRPESGAPGRLVHFETFPGAYLECGVHHQIGVPAVCVCRGGWAVPAEGRLCPFYPKHLDTKCGGSHTSQFSSSFRPPPLSPSIQWDTLPDSVQTPQAAPTAETSGRSGPHPTYPHSCQFAYTLGVPMTPSSGLLACQNGSQNSGE